MPIYWDQNSIQSYQYQYFFFDTSMAPPVPYSIDKTSLAEAYEFTNKYNDQVLALNFPDSVLSNQRALLIIAVGNNNTGTKSIQCADNEHLLKEWIEQNIDRALFYYDKTSTYPPTDNQTCLRSKIRFEETNKRFQSRTVFREIKTGKMWYVDNSHYGEKAHIEVFDDSGDVFLGEAPLDGSIIINKKSENPHNASKSSKKKAKRKLKLK
ncbi:hypothetical protein [Parabacteroides sp. FAFU027]|uniref:hypothetical protein n=1 Tax=Parabacteroides sp. FAFU027 TaxID=2922715 RepID=UPI001FAF1151|nr:hypothetical protein [Parabacteroides sp. FAFU027]